MCTLIALHRCLPGAELVIAANRDEFLDRPASGPALRAPQGCGGAVVSPRDEHAGGTWLGVNAAGLFAGITNRPTARPDPTRRSRGPLVLDVLAASDAPSAAGRLEALPSGAYNPFNLFVGDGREAFSVVYEEGPRIDTLAPGVHVIGNVEPDDPSDPKGTRIRSRVEALVADASEDPLEALGALCRSHDGGADPLESVCVHAGDYGTRSSTLLRLGPDRPALRFAGGPPCRTPYCDFTPLLHALGREAATSVGERAARTAS